MNESLKIHDPEDHDHLSIDFLNSTTIIGSYPGLNIFQFLYKIGMNMMMIRIEMCHTIGVNTTFPVNTKIYPL